MKVVVKYNNKQKKYEYDDIANILKYDEITYIDFSYNSLKELFKLPPKLIRLKCIFVGITILPILPKILRVLYCSFNEISVIDEIPPLSVELECQGNQLKCLLSLPNSLRKLVYFDNEIDFTLPQLRFVQRMEREAERVNVNISRISIYDDKQNVHSLTLHISLMESINNLFR